jgi:L-iditol 2-dehydrogenase
MLAAVYHGANDLRLEQVQTPEAGPGEILIQVLSASICGTDLRILHGAHRMFPSGTVRIPGHEVVGNVAAMGAGVSGYRVGERVFIAPNWGCGHCRQCVTGNSNRCASYGAIGVTRDGGFAQFVLVPAVAVTQGCVMPVSESVDPSAAALIEPFACVLRGQDALHIQPGELVVVMGAGPIGQMHVRLARLRGAARIPVSETNGLRREQILPAGADRVVDPSVEDLEKVVSEESGGLGADVIIVAAPVHAAQEQAMRLAGIGGRINFFGGLPKDKPFIQFDSNLVHYKELLVTGTTACSTADCRRSAEIISSGRVDLSSLVSMRFPLERALEAFVAAEDRTALKVVIKP